MYLIKQVSEMSGVSVRTLQHYDNIGLLSPKRYENGYRYYSEEHICVLQTILFYKYLGFTLKQIKELLSKEDKDLLFHLKKQLELMQSEKNRLLTLIDTLQKTIMSKERNIDMSVKDKFKGFIYEDNKKYREAAMDKYGKEVIEESDRRQKGKEKEVVDGFNDIFFKFSHNMSEEVPVNAEENIALAKNLHEHICKYSFDCSLEVFSKIGYGYVKGDEFKRDIDQFGKGTAQYVCDAVQEYVKNSK